MNARDEAVAAELVRAHHVIEDQANELHATKAQVVILRAVLTQIRDGARDPVSLAEIALREAT